MDDVNMQPQVVEVKSVGERMSDRLEELGMSVQFLSDKVDVSIQTLHQIIREPQRGLHSKNATKIAEVLKVNERWLVSGLGPKERLAGWKLEVLEALEGLSDEEKERILWIVRSVKNKQKE